MNPHLTKWFLIVITALLSITPNQTPAQIVAPDSNYITVVAGKQYAISERRQRKWGEHYRKEWNEPVRVKIAMLDTLAGGLTPYQAGGGRQSKTLRLKDREGREYVLRSIDKTFGKALPDITHGTFIESVADDQVSIGHPYAALTIPLMSKAAGIYHTRPQLVFIPKQPRLGTFNEEFGDILYLFEQRPDENWETADNFGNPKNIIGTEKLLERLLEDNKRSVDQSAYVRARLFDLLIGDWGRHEDQFRWAQFEKDGRIIYRPVPRDRDQAYTRFDGSMVTFIFSVGGLDHLQSFEKEIEDVTIYNFPARNLDRRMANELEHEAWIAIAKDLQARLTDTIIATAVRQMPPEVFRYSGQDIIDKLKSRRDHLAEYADTYYRFIAKAVDIPATNEKEWIDVSASPDKQVSVKMYDLKKNGSTPFYSRDFKATETGEIRIYGMGGKDMITVHGDLDPSVKLRIIPGEGPDSLIDKSTTAGTKKFIQVYDDNRYRTGLSRHSRLHVSSDSLLNNFQYHHFEYDDRGFVFRPGITIGVGYQVTRQGWRKTPFATQHRVMGYYGPNRGSVALEYRYIINQLIGKWDLEAIARADIPFVANFYGIGNESVINTDVNPRYYRYRSTRYSGGVDIHRLFDSSHLISFQGLVQSIKVINDEDRFIAKEPGTIPLSAFGQHWFAGAGITYQFKKSDHPVVPSRGTEFNLGALYTQQLNDGKKSIGTYNASFSFYLPFFKVLSLAVRAGGATVSGDPEFYQLATLSGKENLRGFRRQRFYGKTSFYNNNELRLILDARNRLFNGKAGLLAFWDQGRVWQPGEESDTWHHGYGGGFFFAPFNRILFNATYGISKDDRVIHLRIGFLF